MNRDSNLDPNRYLVPSHYQHLRNPDSNSDLDHVASDRSESSCHQDLKDRGWNLVPN